MKKPDFISIADWNTIKNLKNLKKILKKIKSGYPIQYIIGYVDFFDIKILVNKNVLIPRFETEELVEKTLKLVNNKKINVIDLGTGSGCIACCIKSKLSKSNVSAIDISKKALKIAKKNAKLNNLDINFYHQDIRKPLKDKYDLIISNPPYLSLNDEIEKKVLKYEPHKALYAAEDGLEIYKQIIKNSKYSLNKKGILAFEINPRNKTKIINLLKQNYPNSKIICKKDLKNNDRFIFLKNNE